MLRMSELDLSGRRVLIRVDINVPIKDGHVTNLTRIDAAVPTIQAALSKGARVMVMSHLGRPTEGQFEEAFSLGPVADVLAKRLQHPVRLERDWLNGVTFESNEVILCENVRFNVGEKSNDEALSKAMASLCDVFVMDAFATAHRAQASTEGVARYAPIVCAGPLLIKELAALEVALANPAKPFAAIVGGSKVSSKLILLESLLDKVDILIAGGGIANTFLYADGHPIGDSLYEADLVEDAKRLLTLAQEKEVLMPLPVDVVVSCELSENAKTQIKSIDAVEQNDKILDVGPETSHSYETFLKTAGTIVWNGPVGVFELSPFSEGTRRLAEAVANSPAKSMVGGGDTLSAVDQFGVRDKLSYISTGGGAFLTYLEGRPLPAVAILEQRAQEVVC